MKKQLSPEDVKRIESIRRRIEKIEADFAAIIRRNGPRKPAAGGKVCIKAG